MHRFIKTFLLWLLLAALPLQGFAAAMQSSCGPANHHDAPSGVTSAQPHHHAAGDGVHIRHAAQFSKADHAGAGKHATSSCSSCPACCVGAIALPCGSVTAPVYGPSVTVALTSPLLLADFIPGGPERPPKPVTA